MKFIEILQVFDGVRRYFLRKFNKNYVKNKLAKRKGKCKKCGKCCKGCIYLNKKTKRCKIYKHRPKFLCYQEFPLDRRDQKLWRVEKTCGYKFK